MKKFLKGGVLLTFIAVLVLTAFGCTTEKTVATVNGEKVTQSELYERMKQRTGKQILDQLITEKLILQEAKKKNVAVGEEEINKKLSEIKKQFPKEEEFKKALESNGVTIEQLKDQIKVQVVVEKIVGKDIKVTEEKIKEYYDQNKEWRFKDKTIDQVKEEITNLLKQQQLGQKTATWMEEIKKKAKIENTLDPKGSSKKEEKPESKPKETPENNEKPEEKK